MHLADHPARRRLDAALDGLAVTFRGMTARPDETNCVCHWGSAEELALLKTADAELDPDLLHRAWQATDWTDHAAVLRRILPQFATALANGDADLVPGPAAAGASLARGRWQQWPDDHAGPLREFLHAWWAQSLTDPEAALPAHEVFVVCAEASGTVTPWLTAWERHTGPLSDRHLIEAAAEWEYELLGDNLPWSISWYDNDADEMHTDLAAWLLDHAAPRLRAADAPTGLRHRLRLLALPTELRWTDPHWPDHRH
ncbi:hypothetical protein ABZ023_04040 [Streptomyces sp. NPDC006367]|uniref:hypothetical protein n=1 Tax=unclassified Streptomyces TaxID=2593676 RepID=UPI0033BC2423